MKSVPGTVFFKPMKEEPRIIPFLGIGNLIDAGRAPYRPGEKCYVREGWCRGKIEQADGDDESYLGDFYVGPGNDVIFEQYCIEHNVGIDDVKWLSPMTLSAKYARRFVTILSCEPVRVSEVTEEDCLAVGLKKITKDNGRTWKYGMADRDGLPGTDNTGWAWEDWKVDYREAFKVWWHKRHPDKEWAWRVESEGNQG